MTILHKIKFWLAQKRGLVAKKKPVIVTEQIDIESRKRILIDQYAIEADPLKRKMIDEEFQQLERYQKTWQKTKI